MAGTIDILYDPEDEAIFLSRKWYISSEGYAVWRGVVDGKKQTVRLHRLINKTPDSLFTDHINRNKLDNRRANLRTVTQAENNANGPGNRIKRVYSNLPLHITFDKSRSKYMTKVPNQRRFNTLNEAIEYRGII